MIKDEYLNRIRNNFKIIYSAIEKHSIKLVNLSVADSQAETLADLESTGLDKEKSFHRAKEIINVWSNQ